MPWGRVKTLFHCEKTVGAACLEMAGTLCGIHGNRVLSPEQGQSAHKPTAVLGTRVAPALL